MEIVPVDPTSLVKFENIRDGEIIQYNNYLYVKTGYISDEASNDNWNCYRIGFGGGTDCIEYYELVLPVKKLTVDF